jgi:hypothetical protein
MIVPLLYVSDVLISEKISQQIVPNVPSLDSLLVENV